MPLSHRVELDHGIGGRGQFRSLGLEDISKESRSIYPGTPHQVSLSNPATPPVVGERVSSPLLPPLVFSQKDKKTKRHDQTLLYCREHRSLAVLPWPPQTPVFQPPEFGAYPTTLNMTSPLSSQPRSALPCRPARENRPKPPFQKCTPVPMQSRRSLHHGISNNPTNQANKKYILTHPGYIIIQVLFPEIPRRHANYKRKKRRPSLCATLNKTTPHSSSAIFFLLLGRLSALGSLSSSTQ